MTDELNNIFFVFGMPKSGTTWVQTAINAHPETSCSPEQNFSVLAEHIPRVLTEYNETLVAMQERTAKQEIIGYDENDAAWIFKLVILKILSKLSGKMKGVKDNSLMKDINVYTAIFPFAKHIHVIRDPRDAAVSAWHHNLRVEPGFQDRSGTLPVWAVQFAQWWREGIEKIDTEFGDSEQLHTIRYEDLKRIQTKEFQELFNFLGVDTETITINDISEQTDFEKLKKTGNEFYRKAKVGDYKTQLDQPTLSAVWDECGEMAEWYGYGE